MGVLSRKLAESKQQMASQEADYRQGERNYQAYQKEMDKTPPMLQNITEFVKPMPSQQQLYDIQRKKQYKQEKDVQDVMEANPELAAIVTSMTGLERGATYGTGQALRNSESMPLLERLTSPIKKAFDFAIDPLGLLPKKRPGGPILPKTVTEEPKQGTDLRGSGKQYDFFDPNIIARNKYEEQALKQNIQEASKEMYNPESPYLPSLETVSELGAFGITPVTKVVGAAGSGTAYLGSKLGSKVAPKIMEKILPTVASPLAKTAAKTGFEMGAFGGTGETARLYEQGGLENVLQNKGSIAEQAAINAIIGAGLGTGLGVAGKTIKDILPKLKSSIIGEDVAKQMERFRQEQVGREFVPETPFMREADPRITTGSEMPLRYQPQAPRQEGQLLLNAPRENPYQVAQEFRRETVGEPTRNVRPTTEQPLESPRNVFESEGSIKSPSKNINASEGQIMRDRQETLPIQEQRPTQVMEREMSDRQLPEIWKMTTPEIDAHYGLDKAPSKESITNLIEDVGAKVINKVGTKDIGQLINHFTKKYNLPEIKFDFNLNNLKSKSGKITLGSTRPIKKNGEIVGYKISIHPEQSIEGQIGALRHEIEHVIDLKNGFKSLPYNFKGGKTGREVYGGASKGHHKNYGWFEPDYLRRAEIKDAIKRGEKVPESVLDEYPDLRNYRPKQTPAEQPVRAEQPTITEQPLRRTETAQVTEQPLRQEPQVRQETQSQPPKNTEQKTYTSKDPNKKVSSLYRNTVKRGNYLSDDAKKAVDKLEYTEITEKQTTAEAMKKIEKDGIEKTKQELSSGKEGFNATETESAMMIAQDLASRKDYVGLNDWYNVIRPVFTRMGQGTQALVKWSRTPAGYLREASDILSENVPKKVRENFDKITKEINRIAKLEILDSVDSLADKKKLIEKLFKEKGIKVKVKKGDKLMKLIDGKVFEEAELRTVLAEKLKIPQLTPELSEKIVMYGEELMKLDKKGFYDLRKADEIYTRMITDISNSMPTTLAKRINTYQIVSQLLSPVTFGKNFGGNELYYRANQVSRGLESTIDKIWSKVTGKEREILTATDKRKIIKELDKEYGEDTSFWGSFKKGTKSAMKGYSLYGGKDYKHGLSSTAFKSKYNPLHWAERITGASLKAPDYAAVTRGAMDRVFEMANLVAKNKGLKGLERETFIKDFIRNLDAESYKTAMDFGKKMTFQNETVGGTIATQIRDAVNIAGIGRKTRTYGDSNIGSREFGLADIVGLKYARTTGNILSASLEFTPLGYVNVLYQLATKTTRREAIEAFSKATVGTGMGVMAYKLAELGILTEPMSKDADVRSLVKETGLANNALNLSALKRWIESGFDSNAAKRKNGDKIETVEWAMPTNLSALIGGAIAHRKNLDKSDALGVTVEALDAAASTITESSLLRAARDSARDATYNRFFEKLASNAATSFTGNLMNRVRQYTDTTKRDTSSDTLLGLVKNNLMNKYPILSKDLPPVIKSSGEEEKLFEGGSENPLNIFLNPGFLTEYKSRPGIDVVLSLYEQTGKTKQFPRKINDKTVSINNVEYPLTPQQQKGLRVLIGLETMNRLDKLANNPKFNKLSADQQIDYIVDDMSAVGRIVRGMLEKSVKKDLGIKDIPQAEKPQILPTPKPKDFRKY